MCNQSPTQRGRQSNTPALVLCLRCASADRERLASACLRPIADITATGHAEWMTLSRARSTMVAAVFLGCMSNQAFAKGGQERWIAYSRTAMAITGDILLSPTRLRASGVDFPLRIAADLPAFGSDFDRPVPARVLAVTRRMDPKLRNGNTLGCGHGRPIRWIVVWQYDDGKALGMDTFASGQMPKSVKDAGFCGSYFYSRKRMSAFHPKHTSVDVVMVHLEPK